MKLTKLFGKKEEGEAILAPVTGTLVPIEEVGDAAFSQKILGDGLGVVPGEGRLYAPAAGIVQGLQEKTGHALCITSASGVELLLHIGRDTVKMEGRGFTVKVKEGQKVRAGDLLVEFDLDAIRAEGYDTVTPIVVLNWEEYEIVKAAPGPVTHGDPILTLKKK